MCRDNMDGCCLKLLSVIFIFNSPTFLTQELRIRKSTLSKPQLHFSPYTNETHDSLTYNHPFSPSYPQPSFPKRSNKHLHEHLQTTFKTSQSHSQLSPIIQPQPNLPHSCLKYRLPEELPPNTFVGNIARDSLLSSKYSPHDFIQLRFYFLVNNNHNNNPTNKPTNNLNNNPSTNHNVNKSVKSLNTFLNSKDLDIKDSQNNKIHDGETKLKESQETHSIGKEDIFSKLSTESPLQLPNVDDPHKSIKFHNFESNKKIQNNDSSDNKDSNELTKSDEALQINGMKPPGSNDNTGQKLFSLDSVSGDLRSVERMDREAVCSSEEGACVFKLDVVLQPIQYLLYLFITF